MDRGMAGESQAPVMLGLWGMDATKGNPGGPATSLTPASLTVTGTQSISLHLSGGEHIPQRVLKGCEELWKSQETWTLIVSLP